MIFYGEGDVYSEAITLGACIRTLRMQNNLPQFQLAELRGITDKAVSKWERLFLSGHSSIGYHLHSM